MKAHSWRGRWPGSTRPASASTASASGPTLQCPCRCPASPRRDDLLRDDSAHVMLTRLDESTLRSVWRRRRAASTSVPSRAAELRAALDRIAVEERRQIGLTTTVEYQDVHLPLLAMAVALSLVAGGAFMNPSVTSAERGKPPTRRSKRSPFSSAKSPASSSASPCWSAGC